MNKLQASLEAILFAAGDAVSLIRLSHAVNATIEEIEQALQILSDLYDFEQRGIMLLRIEDKAQLCSRPIYADLIRSVLESQKSPQLSPAALEVLTIVAYRQPVTRAYIEQLRGVDSSGTVATLVEKGLICEAGRLDVPGRPILFRTTDAFLRAFSLANLNELPALPELAEGEQLQLTTNAEQTE